MRRAATITLELALTATIKSLIVVACLLLLAMFGATQVHAATYIVNSTQDTGNGSLRRAISSANGSAGSIINFNIPTSDSGYNSATGVFTITLASALPAITASTIIDATTQANTNPGTLGAGGTVGVNGLTLSTVNRPEIQLVGNNTIATGFDIQASNVTIRGFAIYGFGTNANNDSSANIRIGTFSGTLIEQNIIGAKATTFSDPGAGVRSVGDDIRFVGASGGTSRNNLIGFSQGKGIGVEASTTGVTITNNEIRGNGITNSNLDGVDIENSSNAITVSGNLIVGNEGVGVDSYQSTGSNSVVNNTVTGNGFGTGANVETAGVRLFGTGSTVDRNIINANYGAGVMVVSNSTGNTITRNSIYANGSTSNEIGIDLLSSADSLTIGTSPFVTLNDSGDADAGGNTLLNFPVFTSAVIVGGNLTLSGYARSGSVIEVFVAAPDASGFGEGQTYLTTLTEGSAADTDATSGAYTSPINGVNVGTDTTNKFRFVIAVPAGVAARSILTATATLASSTSEFSPNVTVTLPPNVALAKCVMSGAQCVNSIADAAQNALLTYSIAYTNTGGTYSSNLVVADAIPANTDFKVGSATNAPGTSGLTVVVSYSNDNGATWTYTPASGGGGAVAGYDRNVTNIRWTFTGNLSQTAPNNTGSVGFTVRIR